jgi:hypothetical protein
MALMTYLIKDRHGTYYFRRVIPSALRPFMPPPFCEKANFKRSLETKRPALAKIEASKALRDCTVAFQYAERAMRGGPAKAMIDDEARSVAVEDIEADAIAMVLAADEAEREEGDDRRHLQTAEERKQWPDLVEVSRRKVPLHPHLERVGLLRYRQSLIDRDRTLRSRSGDLLQGRPASNHSGEQGRGP